MLCGPSFAGIWLVAVNRFMETKKNDSWVSEVTQFAQEPNLFYQRRERRKERTKERKRAKEEQKKWKRKKR